MPIVYALVARQRHVLAEFTYSTGNFLTVTRVLLSKMEQEQDGKMSYVYDQHVFHYIIDKSIIFLCMADEATPRRLIFSFLEDIIKVWRQMYDISVEGSAIAFSLNDKFAPVLREKMEFYNHDPSADNISRVKTQIDTVKEVMIENIDRILERGEKIELLVDKTEKLNQESFKFVRQTRKLKNKMRYRNIMRYVIVSIIVSILALFIAILICHGSLTHCHAW